MLFPQVSIRQTLKTSISPFPFSNDGSSFPDRCSGSPPVAPVPRPHAGQPRHTTDTKHMVLYKIRRIFIYNSKRQRKASLQAAALIFLLPSNSDGHRGTNSCLRDKFAEDQECPAHVALPKQPEAQDGCEVPAVLPSAGNLFLTSCPITTLTRPGQLPGHRCSAGTAPKHSQALPSWAPNDGETSGIPFQLFPGKRD